MWNKKQCRRTERRTKRETERVRREEKNVDIIIFKRVIRLLLSDSEFCAICLKILEINRKEKQRKKENQNDKETPNTQVVIKIKKDKKNKKKRNDKEIHAPNPV